MGRLRLASRSATYHQPQAANELVAAEPGHQEPPARRLEQRELKERVGWIEEAVAPQEGRREGSQAVHLIGAHVQYLPIAQPEVANHIFLP